MKLCVRCVYVQSPHRRIIFSRTHCGLRSRNCEYPNVTLLAACPNPLSRSLVSVTCWSKQYPESSGDIQSQFPPCISVLCTSSPYSRHQSFHNLLLMKQHLQMELCVFGFAQRGLLHLQMMDLLKLLVVSLPVYSSQSGSRVLASHEPLLQAEYIASICGQC